ncbi:MAG: VCBS repeat-containing protein [Prevotella sp.]|nr:VCBS repeat-containing protein [Prevotella sp.]
MKKITLIALLSLLSTLLSPLSTLRAQQRLFPEFVQYAGWAGCYGGCTAVDLNNDTYADLVIAGFGRTATNTAGRNDVEKKRMSHVLLINPEADMLRWKQINDRRIAFNVTDRPAITPCDFNRDGNMDIVAFETTGRLHDDQPYTSGYSCEGIFLGNGDGSFTAYQPSFVDAGGSPIDFDMRKFLSGTVADLNNDGLLDIVGIGYQTNASGNAKTYETCNYVLINLGDDTFRVTPIFDDDEVYHFEMAFVRVYDLNSDGAQDFIITGQVNDNAALGRTVKCLEPDQCTENHFFDIFLGDPAQPGTFHRQYLQDRSRWGGSTVWAVGECGLSIGDVDSDGLPDLYIVGYCGTGRKHDIWGLFRATRQSDGSVRYDVDYSCPVELARPLNTVPNQNGFIDWDGDGHLDYVSAGWFGSMNTQTALIYTNPQGKGNFVKTYRMGSSSELSSCFVDWNADGVNDYVEMGQSWDGMFFLSNPTHFQATLNPHTPANGQPLSQPDAPLLGEVISDDTHVTLSWQLPTTAVGNETFEYWVKDSSGQLVTSCNSFIGGELDGKRKVVGPGNACQAKTVTLTLPQGSYTYGVQTVDASYHGSPFATGTFTVGTTGILDEGFWMKDESNTSSSLIPNPSSIYDLQGRRISSSRKGVYILNNKKIIK